MTALKTAAERVLLAAAPLTRRMHRGRILVLAYHNVVPDGEALVGDTSLHVAQRSFARHLDLLSETHDVVPLLTAMNDAAASRPRAVITFDDAYAGAVAVGVQELVSRRLPATIFVAPGLLEGRQFWWDELANTTAGEMASAVRGRAIDALAGDGSLVRDSLGLREAPPLLPAYATGATLDALTGAAAQPGITLGSHSWSHPNLTRVEPARLQDELSRPLAWLREKFPSTIPWLAYPYGLASAAVARSAATAGYDGAFLVHGGWLPRRTSTWQRHLLPRINVPSRLSEKGFRLLVSGVPLPRGG